MEQFSIVGEDAMTWTAPPSPLDHRTERLEIEIQLVAEPARSRTAVMERRKHVIIGCLHEGGQAG